jgi:hypothetical protein
MNKTEAKFMNVLRFLGIILRVLKLEVSVNNVYITNHYQGPILLKGVRGGVRRDDCE